MANKRHVHNYRSVILFLSFFQIGSEVFKKCCDRYPSEWLALQKNFETEKKNFPNISEDITFPFPVPLIDSYRKARSESLSKKLERLGCHTQLVGNNMIIQNEQMKTFFNEAVRQINMNIRQLLDTEYLRGVNYILLVGGFSESSFVKDGIKKEFKSKKVIAPAAPSEATLKGAVMYGTNPDIIASRISPYSYGVQTRATFNQRIHPEEAKIKVGERYVVNNAFDKHIEIGQSIRVGDSANAIGYKVTNTKNRNVWWNVYKSVAKKDPGVCSAAGCAKIGKLSIIIPEAIKEDHISLELKMICRGTELEAIARTVKHSVMCHATFDFLGLEDELAGDIVPEKL